VDLISKIKEQRKKKGLMQKFVAEQCNISQQMLSEYENGKTYPRANILFKLAEVIGCEVGDLYERKVD
jgi:putative transcriptional regulator